MNRVKGWLGRSKNGAPGKPGEDGQRRVLDAYPGAGAEAGAFGARAGANGNGDDHGVPGGAPLSAGGVGAPGGAIGGRPADARVADIGPAVRPEQITVHTTEVHDDAAKAFGAYEVTKKTDFWFDLEVSRLEKDAREEARKQALAGTPRPGVADDALAIEKHLEARAAELFRRWVERVRTKVSDAIADAARHAGASLLEYRARLASLRKTLSQATTVDATLEALRSTPPTGSASLGFTSFLKRWHYWALMLVLIAVDWVANVPVFAELLPREPGAEDQWATIVAHSEKFGVLGGLYRVGARILFAPDVSLLAFGVIAFLVFLAHVLGESLRQRIAIREEDLPEARPGIRSHRRQFALPAVFSALGVVLVVGVLFMARERIHTTTEQRLAESRAQVTTLETQLGRARQAGDLDGIARAQQQLPEARSIVDERAKRAQYAAGIESMNLPILLLNIVLVISAALAAYLAKGERLEERRLIDPRLSGLESERERLVGEAAEHRAALHRLGGEVLDQLALAHRLVHSGPLRGWEGKADRLAGVVPLFRAENARERALDPANILAFQRPVALALPAIDADAPIEPPAELLKHEEEFDRLRGEWLALEGAAQAEGGNVA